MFTHCESVGHCDSHSRLTYIEDNAAVIIAEFDLRKRGRCGSRLGAPVGRRRQSPEVFLQTSHCVIPGWEMLGNPRQTP